MEGASAGFLANVQDAVDDLERRLDAAQQCLSELRWLLSFEAPYL
jgi:hypothetical protein